MQKYIQGKCQKEKGKNWNISWLYLNFLFHFSIKKLLSFVIKKIQFYASLLAHASLTSLKHQVWYTYERKYTATTCRQWAKKIFFQYSFVTPLMIVKINLRQSKFFSRNFHPHWKFSLSFVISINIVNKINCNNTKYFEIFFSFST